MRLHIRARVSVNPYQKQNIFIRLFDQFILKGAKHNADLVSTDGTSKQTESRIESYLPVILRYNYKYVLFTTKFRV